MEIAAIARTAHTQLRSRLLLLLILLQCTRTIKYTYSFVHLRVAEISAEP